MSIPTFKGEAVARVEKRRRIKADYQIGIGPEALKDLASFCFAYETTFHLSQNARTQAMLEGRRQVWMRIEQHLKLSPEDLVLILREVVLAPTGANDGCKTRIRCAV